MDEKITGGEFGEEGRQFLYGTMKPTRKRIVAASLIENQDFQSFNLGILQLLDLRSYYTRGAWEWHALGVEEARVGIRLLPLWERKGFLFSINYRSHGHPSASPISIIIILLSSIS